MVKDIKHCGCDIDNVSKRVLGLVGTGSQALKRAKKIADTYQMKLLFYDPYHTYHTYHTYYPISIVDQHSHVEICANIFHVSANADIIWINVPSSNETIGLINRQVLANIKYNVILVITSPLEVIDEEGLEEILEKGIPGGVMLLAGEKEYPGLRERYSRFSSVTLYRKLRETKEEISKRMCEEAAASLCSFFGKMEKTEITAENF